MSIFFRIFAVFFSPLSSNRHIQKKRATICYLSPASELAGAIDFLLQSYNFFFDICKFSVQIFAEKNKKVENLCKRPDLTLITLRHSPDIPSIFPRYSPDIPPIFPRSNGTFFEIILSECQPFNFQFSTFTLPIVNFQLSPYQYRSVFGCISNPYQMITAT